jgi:hypothetical protein
MLDRVQERTDVLADTKPAEMAEGLAWLTFRLDGDPNSGPPPAAGALRDRALALLARIGAKEAGSSAQ